MSDISSTTRCFDDKCFSYFLLTHNFQLCKIWMKVSSAEIRTSLSPWPSSPILWSTVQLALCAIIGPFVPDDAKMFLRIIGLPFDGETKPQRVWIALTVLCDTPPLPFVICVKKDDRSKSNSAQKASSIYINGRVIPLINFTKVQKTYEQQKFRRDVQLMIWRRP